MKKRILYIASTFQHIFLFHRPYLKQLKNDGYDVYVVGSGELFNIPEATALIAVPMEKRFLSFSNALSVVKLRKLINSNFDAIISNTSLASFLIRSALINKKKRPIVVTIVHGYLFDEKKSIKSFILKLCEKLLASKTDVLIAMNDWDYNYAVKKHLGKQIFLIDGMGVNRDNFTPISEHEYKEARRILNIKENEFVMLYVAEFSNRKNHKMLIKALTRLNDNEKLIFAGSGSYEKRIKDTATRLGVINKIMFIGYVNDIRRAYSVADVVVSSSKGEGLPFNILEGMCCKLPVVASDVKGNNTIIDRENGLLFAAENIEEFVFYINKLKKNRKFYNEIAEKGQCSVKKYTLDSVFQNNYGIITSSFKNNKSADGEGNDKQKLAHFEVQIPSEKTF